MSILFSFIQVLFLLIRLFGYAPFLMVAGLHFILEKGLSNFLWSVFLHFVKLLKVEGSHKLAYNVPGFAKVWNQICVLLGTVVCYYFKVEVKYLAWIYSVKLRTKVWLFTFVEVQIRLPHFCKTLCYMPYSFASLLCFFRLLLEDNCYLCLF